MAQIGSGFTDLGVALKTVYPSKALEPMLNMGTGEVDVLLESGVAGRAMVPSVTSAASNAAATGSWPLTPIRETCYGESPAPIRKATKERPWA